MVVVVVECKTGPEMGIEMEICITAQVARG